MELTEFSVGRRHEVTSPRTLLKRLSIFLMEGGAKPRFCDQPNNSGRRVKSNTKPASAI